jgi:hypothetical protein
MLAATATGHGARAHAFELVLVLVRHFLLSFSPHACALQIASAMSSEDVFQDWDIVENLWSHAFT